MFRTIRIVLATTFLVATAILVGSAGSAVAQVNDPFTVGYVWNDLPSQSGCHSPAPYYSYNSRVTANSICRTGIGSYVVHFPRLASSGGNAQVTTYGSAPANCKVAYWIPNGTEEQVGVNCFTFSGAARDSNFTASFTAGGGSANTIAFTWANNPSAASYTPSSTYQYNNRGGLANITRSNTGAYTVSFPNSSGASATGGVKVTSYGSGSSVCKVVNWGPNVGATAEQVNVQCYNSSGAASDEQFSVVYVNGMNILGDNLLADGYAWANQPSASSYTPALAYQRSTTVTHAGTITITRPTPGTYDVFLPYQNEGLDGGHVQVTAYGSGTNRCQVGSWTAATGGRTARIYCFSNTGALSDTFFALQYTAKVQ